MNWSIIRDTRPSQRREHRARSGRSLAQKYGLQLNRNRAEEKGSSSPIRKELPLGTEGL